MVLLMNKNTVSYAIRLFENLRQGQLLIKNYGIHKCSNINGKLGVENQNLQLRFTYMHKWMHICESIRGRLLVVEKVKSS